MPADVATLTLQPACDVCPIRNRAVCAHCEGDDLAELEGMKYYRSFEAGQVIVWAGDQMDFVGSVVSGMAGLTQQLEDGRTQMVGLLLPSDFLGRPGRQIASYTVTATSEIVLCCFRRKPFEKLLAETPHLAGRLLEMTLDELDAARDWLLLLGRKSAREKIASFLVILARREAALARQRPKGRFAVELPLTREAMADYLGLTLETVSRQMNTLKREGVIELEGKRRVIIPSFEDLVIESGEDSDGGLPS
ncbi:transcriptional regulator FnrL [Paracoccus aestuariivivens]|uniref:Helix-turn-helix domain-containing protein n=1 Tax=Paracoccus aestuariivivens TaxID=1820333 RepID=A0A6L6J9P4_9RHOB|nr:Crp/Fnr family transcriptional regulator [Paracoccus aestuariivivens]MTH77397.1 helix-turn-helix domain-containing protein [Paracoccus aestuariivivens]